MSYEYLATWVYFHELGHAVECHSGEYDNFYKQCTAVLVKKSDGSIVHGRNMD